MAERTSGLTECITKAVGGTRAPLVLELDITEGLVETPPTDPISAALSQRKPRLQDVIDGLSHASSDPHVVALVVKVGGDKISLTQAQELHGAISAFRASGKHTVAWAETFGEFGVGNVPYVLAVACGRICLQPSGDVGLTGIGMEESFLHGALDKAGVTPELGQRHEYKTAANTYLQDGYTDAHREMSERLVGSLSEQVVTTVAVGRDLSEQRVRELIDQAPLIATEALEAGLVDALVYRDEVYAEVRQHAGTHARLQYVTRYHHAITDGLARRVKSPRRKDGLALIFATGMIRQGRSSRSPFGPAAGADTVSAAFRAAVKDSRIKAIVFRVDSPGGSYVASDTIWRHVALARRHGKPVVVSMGKLAASGGYFVAMGADAIVAQPGTLTGSIGVLGGKAVTADLKARFGLTHDAVSGGDHSLMFSSNRHYTNGEWERLNRSLDRVYADFTAKAAEGRGLAAADIESVARGRVWTGADARDSRLVDELGGLDRAVELAKNIADLPPDRDVDLLAFPKTNPLERLRPPKSSEDTGAATGTAPLEAVRLAAWGRFAPAAAALGLPAAGPLMLPGTWNFQ